MTEESPLAKFKDSMHRWRTESLFLELCYDTTTALYTLQDEDREYEGVPLPSIKRLYLEVGDPTEYRFARKYFGSWEHWQIIAANQTLLKHIEQWREELEVALRSAAVSKVLKLTDGNFNAAKWAADGQWNTKRGRPSKDEMEREKRIRARAASSLAEDGARVLHLIRKGEKDA